MNTKERNTKFNTDILALLRRAVASDYFPFFTAAVTLGCYYLSLDMVIIWYMAICGTFILLFTRDGTPLITIFLFMNIMISMRNSPTLAGGNDPSDYYFQPAVLAQIGVGVGVFAAAGVYRMIRAVSSGTFRCTPVFFGLCLFAAGIMFNGIFSQGYTPMNAVYGFFMAFMFLGVFVICSDSVAVNGDTYRRIALSFIALTICLMIELAVAYLTYDNLWTEDGGIDRTALYFGWGMYNTMGMLFTISLPAAAYLACRSSRGWVFTIYLVLLEGCILVSMSRQAMLIGSFIFVVCALWILVKSAKKRAHLIIFGAAALAAVGVLIVKRDIVVSVYEMLTNNFFSGSGRDGLYDEAWEKFKANPVFGIGFYRDISADPGFIGLPLMPDMYHNTVFELLAVGGLVAFVPYAVYRMQTIISFFKNPTEDRFFVGLVIASLLILSLLDNHIFYILPTLVYSFMMSVLVNSEADRPVRKRLSACRVAGHLK